MNIIQEALITAWFLVKLGFFGLTAIGAKVVWDKYGHHLPTKLTDFIKQDEEKEEDGEWFEMYR